MARDSQAALVALNRFGFGARGGASGDFVNAASFSAPTGCCSKFPDCSRRRRSARRCSTISSRSSGPATPPPRRHLPLGPKRPPSRRRMQKRNGETCRSAPSPWTSRRRNRSRNRPMRRWPILQLGPPRPCSRMRQSRHRNSSTSSRKPFAPRRWRGCSALPSPIAVMSSGWWCSGPITSASPPARAGLRGCGRARSSARRSDPMCSGASLTC